MKLAQTLLSGSLAAVALAASAPAMAGKVLDGVKRRDQLVFMGAGQILESQPPDQFFHHPQNERSRAFPGKILRQQA